MRVLADAFIGFESWGLTMVFCFFVVGRVTFLTFCWDGMEGKGYAFWSCALEAVL